jgi:hypothetical protein
MGDPTCRFTGSQERRELSNALWDVVAVRRGGPCVRWAILIRSGSCLGDMDLVRSSRSFVQRLLFPQHQTLAPPIELRLRAIGGSRGADVTPA